MSVAKIRHFPETTKRFREKVGLYQFDGIISRPIEQGQKWLHPCLKGMTKGTVYY